MPYFLIGLVGLGIGIIITCVSIAIAYKRLPDVESEAQAKLQETARHWYTRGWEDATSSNFTTLEEGLSHIATAGEVKLWQQLKDRYRRKQR